MRTQEQLKKYPFQPPIHPILFPDRVADLTRAVLIEYLRRLEHGKSMKMINEGLDNDLVEGLAKIGQPPSEGVTNV